MSAMFPQYSPGRSAQRARRAVCGFTLVELIIVIVLLGVLAVVAAPRIFNSGDFNARGFKDQSLSLLRFAQKVAIAQRRTVCVTFTASTATLQIASAAAATICDTPLAGPTGESPARVTAKSGVAYATLPAALQFDGLGQPYSSVPVAALTVATSISVTGMGTPIIIEPYTGYVHE